MKRFRHEPTQLIYEVLQQDWPERQLLGGYGVGQGAIATAIVNTRYHLDDNTKGPTEVTAELLSKELYEIALQFFGAGSSATLVKRTIHYVLGEADLLGLAYYHLNFCECNSTHVHNDTVCPWCWARGRRHPSDPEGITYD
jgi:hypothetical protein